MTTTFGINPTRGISRRNLGRLLAGAAIVAAGPGLAVGVRAQDAMLRVRIGSDISVLDPMRIFQVENQTVAGHIYNGLVKYDQATNEIVPDLASQWSISEDGLTYAFNLRNGVVWHKGYGPFTSDDVKFSFERVLDPASSSPYAGQLSDVQAIETPDPLTVRILLKNPNAGFLHKVTAFNQGWLVSRKAVTEIGSQRYAMQPIGTGPFVFEGWTPGNEVRLSANQAYFEGAPQVGGVAFRVIREEMAAAIALENSEIDIFFALQAPAVITRLQNASGITVLDRPANHTINLVLNTTVEPLHDVRVRRAVAHAINRQALIDGFFKGTKGTAYNVLTPSFPEYSEDVPTYPFDPGKAKALLQEAGVESFELPLVTPAFSPYDKIVVPIANDLNAVGIKASIQALERGAYLQARNKGDIPTAVTGVVGPPDPDNPIISLYAKKAWPPGLNTSHYAGIEDLLAKLNKARGEEQRTATYRDILVKTMTDIPVIPLYADQLFLAHTEAVQGLVQNSLFTVQTYSVSLKQ